MICVYTRTHTVSLESIVADVSELESGYTAAQKERELKAADCPKALIDFLNGCERAMGKLKDDYTLSQVCAGARTHPAIL
jgi:hypothetical protein